MLLSFTTDPYCSADAKHRLTRTALETFLRHRIPVGILTKAGARCLIDLELFRRFGRSIKVGATLTFFDRGKSTHWEPGAAVPEDRMDTLRFLHQHGVPTWASFEPVIEPAESLACMRATLPYVDEYRVGKLNNYDGLDLLVDWPAFLTDVVRMLRGAGKRFYIKSDLRKAAQGVELTEEETDMDRTVEEAFVPSLDAVVEPVYTQVST